ncbi:peptidoglycan-binding protein [Jannaschia pagri]|uniref:Peptidoglycan-binding protein n=1 Tax=Jannaschia pagri TaxID=2829797 RepID=A0ABQ4NH96_9RHOB|nr:MULTISPECIES: trypsin-like peptidase domain-containing protein [unclassified Jannaschia]GIT90354.1 peptidoglycan-binding protein [Jannaschia sp. AI_61]GIT93540.1 peptidoglycan-binding protein [Jannaschia sp. AI_62]
MRALLAFCLTFTLWAAVWLSGPVSAQEAQLYVQIEAHPNLREAEGRARAYGGILPDINGFRVSGGWYSLALGPYPEAEARATLRRLRSEGLIPRDSYVSDGGTYRDRFWPVGVVTPAVPEVPPAVASSEPATSDASAGVPPVAEAQPDPEPVEETPREARRSESLLTRDEKKELQRALQWFGYYTAAIDGSYGRGTRASMQAWQRQAAVDATGVLTTRQRALLMEEYRAAQAALGLGELVQQQAGVAMTAPMGLVTFDRVEAPFVHYFPKEDSGVRLSLISQAGDRATLGGLYEILQTLEIVPTEGERAKARDSFRIRGEAPGTTTEVFATLEDGHIFGYLLTWPDAQETAAARALASMDETLRKIGPPLPADEGFDPGTQSFDMVSGLEVRKPRRSASGFFVDGSGRVVTAAANVSGCGRITLDRLHEASISYTGDGIAVLRPTGRLAPVEVARLAPSEGRLRSRVSVGGFPFGGVLGAATLSFGSLEDVRGLDGDEDLLRLSVSAQEGDVGGPVLDGAGRVTGMLLPAPPTGDRALPTDVAFAAKASALRTALQAAGVSVSTAEASATIAPEDLTTRAVGMTVLVSCWD